MGKIIDTDSLKGKIFRTGLGMMRFIDSLPGEDVAKVVYCEKCIKYKRYNDFDSIGHCIERPNRVLHGDEDFCSAGIPREGETE